MQTIDYLPECTNIRHIKGSLYEGYGEFSEEILLSKHNLISDYINHSIATFRYEGYFVKKVFMKYYCVDPGCYVLGFELIKLRETKLEMDFHTH